MLNARTYQPISLALQKCAGTAILTSSAHSIPQGVEHIFKLSMARPAICR